MKKSEMRAEFITASIYLAAIIGTLLLIMAAFYKITGGG